MKEFILKNIGFALFLFVVIISVFIFADLKMDNIHFKTRVEELENKVNDLNIKLDGLNNTYRELIVSLISDNIITIADIRHSLPENETRSIEKIIEDKKYWNYER